jgi:Fic family protein
MVRNKNRTSDRAGKYILQPGGYKIFVPNPLPPEPKVEMDEEMIHLLSLADRAIGRLDMATDNLPNPDFFVYAYVVREATLSSQIEGTQATFDDVFDAQIEPSTKPKTSDVDEILNYVNAMNYGLDRLNQELPLCLRLIRGIHDKLLKGVRGENREPGQFRRDQNYIGPDGCTIETATYIPPPANQMNECLAELEKFMNQKDRIPPLIKIAMIHAQFETIHPFRDGNGRIGRLLITLFLCQQNILRQPLLYLSSFLKNNRRLYYENLQTIRDQGDWEEWIKFFLQGIYSVAREASAIARDIIALQESNKRLIQSELGSTGNKALVLLDKLCNTPMVSAKKVSELLGVSPTTAGSLIKRLVDIGILKERGESKRNRIFSYQKYWDIMYGIESSTSRSKTK